MPNIVIEGMDNSGKSTLAQHVASRLGWQIQESEGPPRSSEEILSRVHRYSIATLTVFVRHPFVTNPIYDVTRPPEERTTFPPHLVEEFYQPGNNVFVYCDPLTRALDGHRLKPHDTSVHAQRITDNRAHLLQLYREWAIRYALIMYRIGDDMDLVADLVANATVNKL